MGMGSRRQVAEAAAAAAVVAVGRRGGVICEINVTPIVDVMLVLLIIFMVAAPMMTVGVPIDLPETQAKALNSETQPITISVKKDGQVFLQETDRSRSRDRCQARGDRHDRLQRAHLRARRRDGALWRRSWMSWPASRARLTRISVS